MKFKKKEDSDNSWQWKLTLEEANSGIFADPIESTNKKNDLELIFQIGIDYSQSWPLSL